MIGPNVLILEQDIRAAARSIKAASTASDRRASFSLYAGGETACEQDNAARSVHKTPGGHDPRSCHRPRLGQLERSRPPRSLAHRERTARGDLRHRRYGSVELECTSVAAIAKRTGSQARPSEDRDRGGIERDRNPPDRGSQDAPQGCTVGHLGCARHRPRELSDAVNHGNNLTADLLGGDGQDDYRVNQPRDLALPERGSRDIPYIIAA